MVLPNGQNPGGQAWSEEDSDSITSHRDQPSTITDHRLRNCLPLHLEIGETELG